MTLAEIENLTYAELKEKKDEILASVLEVQKVEDIAARYVQARTDAKMRDEKMSEQGKTIAAMQEGVGALKGKIDHLGETLKQEVTLRLGVEEELKRAQRALVDYTGNSEKTEASLKEKLDTAKSSIKILVEERDAAVREAAKATAAAQQMIREFLQISAATMTKAHEFLAK